MEIKHRLNSNERQHHLLEHRYSFRVKPRLLYVGKLNNTGKWSEEEHNHDYLEILFVKSGKGEVRLNTETLRIGKGDIIIYNAGCNHSETGDEEKPLNLYFLALNKLSMTDLPENHMLPPGYHIRYKSNENYDLFCVMFETMLSEFEKKKNFYCEIAQNISRTMLMYLFRIIDAEAPHNESIQAHKVIAKATAYIAENYRNELSLADIADHCFVSKYYLSHLFPAQLGKTVKQFITEMRINEAIQLLSSTEDSVSQIATQVGISDSAYFSKLFKKETGTSPLEFRKKHKEIRRP